jgi:peptidylprolyl isomerase
LLKEGGKGEKMAKVKEGDTVKVHYKGTLNDGTVFDESKEHGVLEFQIGDEKVIPGFEEAIIGMSAGEKKNTTVKAEKAYGIRNEKLIKVVNKKQVPENVELKVGEQIEVRQTHGGSFPVTVIDITESEVTLDANHPLAGEDLTFEIELVEIT